MTDAPTKPVTLAILDGPYSHEAITGAVRTDPDHNAFTDLAALFRRAADQIETERDQQEQPR